MSQSDQIVEDIETLEAPPLTLQVTDEYRAKMSYGLLMDLQRLLPDATQAMALIMADPYTQDYVVRRVMTPDKATITDSEKLVKSETLELDPEQVATILDWVVKHILHFFAQRAANLAKAGAQFKTALPSLFTSGSPTSASETPSAGPSEPPKES